MVCTKGIFTGEKNMKWNIFKQYSGLTKSAYVLFFARLVTSMGSFIWPMLTLIMSLKLGYSEIEIAKIFLLIAVVFLPGAIIGGKLADKFNKKKIIIIFDLITVTFFILCSLVEPGNLMLIFFCIAGLFATMEGPAHEALAIEASLPKDRDKLFSLTYLGFNIGFIIGAALGGFMITSHLSLAFIIDGTTTLMSTILIIMFVVPIKQEEIKEEDKNKYEEETHHDSGIHILRNRKSILYQILLVTITAFIYDQWSFVIPLHMADLFGDINGPLFYGFVASFNGFVVIIATPLLTYFFRKIFEIPKIITALVLYGISFALLINANELPIFFIFIFLFTIGEILNSISFSPFLSRRIPATHRGRINSYIGIFAFTGMILGKLLIGTLAEKFGFNIAYLSLVVFSGLGAILTYFNYFLDKKLFPDLYKKIETTVKPE